MFFRNLSFLKVLDVNAINLYNSSTWSFGSLIFKSLFFQGKSNSDAKTMADILKKYAVNEAAEDITSAAEYIVEALNKIFKPLITSNTPKNKAIEIIQSDLFNNLAISGGVVTLVGGKYNKLLIKGKLTEQGEKLNKFYIILLLGLLGL